MTDPSTDPVVAIVVAYRSETIISDLAGALAGWLDRDPRAHVVLVNNSPSDATIDVVGDILGDRLDRSLLLPATENIGFAPAVNLGLRRARDRWGPPRVVLLINPDISTSSETVMQLPTHISVDVAVAAPLLRGPDGRSVDRGVARRNWTRRSLFAEVTGNPRLSSWLGAKLRNIDVAGQSGVTPVDITSGAFMAIDGQLLGDGLDTTVPMYFEDQEICIRAGRAGRVVAVVTGIEAVHLGGHSRKLNTQAQRSLRLLELAEAPALALHRSGRVPIWQCRLVVLLGGVVRLLASPPAALAQESDRIDWLREQARLARWFIAWAVRRPASGFRSALGP